MKSGGESLEGSESRKKEQRCLFGNMKIVFSSSKNSLICHQHQKARSKKTLLLILPYPSYPPKNGPLFELHSCVCASLCSLKSDLDALI